MTRKHHCRCCGDIFCYKCCHDFVVIPAFITDRPEPADYWNVSYYLTALKTDEERVCRQCRDMIKAKTAAHERIISIFRNPVSIDHIKSLPETDTNVKSHYFDHMRNIQYYLPNHTYSDIDRKLLRVNAPYFSKHSKYLVHLIKSIEWNPNARLDRSSLERSVAITNRDRAWNGSASYRPNIQPLDRSVMATSMTTSTSAQSLTNNTQRQLEFIMSVINGEKTKRCCDLYCTRTCQEQLSCDDCINILYSESVHLPPQLLDYLFSIIASSPEQIILCHLTFFVTLIKANSDNKLLQTHVFSILNQSLKMIYQTYWFLTNASDGASDGEMRNIKSFIKLFDPTLAHQMHMEYMFYSGLVSNLGDTHRYLTSEFDRYKPISIPYEPQLKLVGVDLDSINQIKSSHTKPVIITFEVREYTTDPSTGISTPQPHSEFIRLLFKPESIMNDVTVLNLMTLSDIILRESLNTNFSVIVYPIIPLTANSGMIEIVENAETIYTILNKSPTILQYIMDKNNNQIVGDVLDRYMYSLVSYTLHSYFIGLGDRHLQNIMITDEGAIFHIDFGFILGTDAYPITATDIKLNPGMLDVIGGSDGHRYKEYLKLSAQGVILLRKYFNMFFILFSSDTQFKERHITRFVTSRFQPKQTDGAVIDELISVIKQSNGAYSSYIRDFIHDCSQKNTLQDGLYRIINAAFGAVVKSYSSSSST